ncbi:penicillin-binding protein [bacterium]|nr:penicillin-binding protein [bacterium]
MIRKSRINLKIIIIGSFFCLCFLTIITRLFYLQQLKKDNFTQLANNQHIRKLKISPKRGEIRDRNGVPFAINVEVDSLFADPRKVEDPYLCAYHLASYFGIDEKKAYKKLTSNRSFVWLKRKVDKDKTAEFKKLGLKGIYYKQEVKRVYPKNEILSHVIGFVGIDGEGLEGLEKYMDNELSGEYGWRIISKDAKRREVWHCMPLEKPAVDGCSIELTIDQMIQYIAESELEKAFLKYQPIWGGIVVMKPRTGEILAMATRPTYNPNRFGDYPAEYRRNRVVTDIFEPGSIFKTISCASSLNEGAVKFSDVFYCEKGAYRIYGHTLHDCHHYEYLSFPQIIAVSSNIGTSKIAMNLGRKKLYNYISMFDFGKKPGLLLNGEASGIFRPLKSWSKLSIVCIPMGQEISVSAVQMLKAVSALANDGWLMKPYFVKNIISPDGKIKKSFGKEPIRQVISPKTAKVMNEALKMVCRRGGTGINAALDEYTVAGKTGTAQKVINGRYSDTNYVGSFVGYAPADMPEISIIVVMDDCKGQYYGGIVAAPVFREVARKVLKYLEIPPENERMPVSKNINSGGVNHDNS